MASTSSQPLSVSVHPPPHWRYDVFLSFRGQDTRNNFTAHLYSALIQKGVNTYKDDKELDRGKTIEPELQKAIEESMFSIVIFSNGYAFSPWCLDELVKIIECMKTREQIVLPIFYDVDPSDIAGQKRSYEKAFKRYEEEFKDDKEKVKMWRNALCDAANLSGWDVRNRDQSEIIKEIVDKVWYDVSNTLLISNKRLVGMEFHMEKMRFLLGEDRSGDIRFIGICGMGGVGKTTIAEVVYDRMRQHFEVSCFLAKVKEAFKNNGVDSLQEQLLSKITKQRDMKETDVKTRASEIRKCLKNKKVLIILDDVDDLEQLELFAGEKDWFYQGSRVIITSRDRHLLSTHGVDGIYEVNVLNDEEAQLLFSHKAFNQDQPPEDYLELSKLVLIRAKGLPLALSVLGSFFCGRNVTTWRSAIERLEEIPHNKVIEVLRISFDALEESEKQIFLDIACCFNGEDKKRVTRALDACGFHAHIGIQVLVEKSLLRISEDDTIHMHELLQVMGRNIVKQESPNDLGGQSRLWDLDDYRQLFEDTAGNKAVEVIAVEVIFLKKREWSLNMRALSKMKKLRILIFETSIYEIPSYGFTYLSKELRYFEWGYCFPFNSLPSSFQPSKLVELHLNYAEIKRLWYGYKTLSWLKVLNLERCNNLVETPDFRGAPNLEKLCLHGCYKLSKLHPSLQKHEKLIEIDLSFCSNLQEFSSSIEMKSLQILSLSGCSKLKKFPTIIGIMPHLSRLCLDNTNIKTLPDSIQNLVGLILIDLRYCRNLQSLPSSIVRLQMLKELQLDGCSNLNKLPENICQLTSLKSLKLGHTGIRRIPASTFLLKNLKELSFVGHPYTRSETTTLELDGDRVRELEVLVIRSVSGMVSLKKLQLGYCNLGERSIPDDIGCLSNLTYLDLTGNNFVSLPRSIVQLGKLSEVILDDCRMLRALPEIPPDVYYLSLNGCIALEEVPDPIKLQNPKASIFQCFNCMKLYKSNGGDNIASKMIRRYLKGCQRSVPRSKFSIIVPAGRKLPRWFGNQTEGDSITMPTPTDMLFSSSEWIGFAACVLFEMRKPSYLSDHYLSSTGGLRISCGIYYIVKDDKHHIFDYHDCYVETYSKKVGAYHVWAFYVSFHLLEELKDKPISHFRLSFGDSDVVEVKVRKCSARFISFQDIRELQTDVSTGSCEDHSIDVIQGDDTEELEERDLSRGFLQKMVNFFVFKLLRFCRLCSYFAVEFRFWLRDFVRRIIVKCFP